MKIQPHVINRDSTFITHPTLTISTAFSPAASYAMALGAVDTGRMKVNEHAMVGGKIRSKGLTHRVLASWIMIGRNMLAEATLAATCVSAEAPKVHMTTILHTGKDDSDENCEPIQADSPDCSLPPPRANPPPKSSMIPQANRLESDGQSKSFFSV